jgi:hypothetical protein
MLSRNADLIAIAILVAVFAARAGGVLPGPSIGELGVHLTPWRPDAVLPCESALGGMLDFVRAMLMVR